MIAAALQGPIPARAGIGLRFPHHGAMLRGHHAVPWVEVHPENYLEDADARRQLLQIRRDTPVSLHAVGMSLGSAAGLDREHLGQLRVLADLISPALMSDHLSWSIAEGRFFPDLLPLPYTEEALGVVCANVQQAQEILGRTLLIENPSTYLQYRHSPIPEPLFLAELVQRTGAGALLDVNNIYVSACNRREDPALALDSFLKAIPPARIGEIHLAGHAVVQTEAGHELRIDDHGSRVCEAVWGLYERALAHLGAVPTLIEWDTHIPPFETLLEEARRAEQSLERHRAVAA